MVSKFSVDHYQFDKKHRYEKNNLEKHVYENEEFKAEFHDEIRLKNISYEEILDKIANADIKPDQLGENM